MNQVVNFVKARAWRLGELNRGLFKSAVGHVKQLARYLQICVGYVGVKGSCISPKKLSLKSTKYRRNKIFFNVAFPLDNTPEVCYSLYVG